MKTETQIAEENIKKYKTNLGEAVFMLEPMKEHKASCQRFLEFLEDYVKGLDAVPVKISVKHKDLKQVIKLYEDNGI